MTTPAGPINISIVEAESPTVTITRTPPPGVTVSGTGPQGAPGTRIYETDGQPSNSVGLAGDYAIDLATGRMYGPKTTVWPTWTQIPAITETGWHANGQANFVGSDIYLTSAGEGFGAGTLWYGTAQASNDVDVTFELEMSGGTGADGITFAFADSSTANTFVGGGGGQLGIVGVNAVAVAFVSAPGEAVKIVTTDATTMTTVVSASADVRPNPVTARVKYNGTKLAVWLDDVQVFDQTISIPANSKVGFTAANGGSDDNHIIRNVTFVPTGGMMLKGEDGIPGPQGPQGIQGPAGEDGADGATYPWVFDVKTYGAVGDGKVRIDGAMTSGGNTVTCATSTPFVSGDVGKKILIKGAGPTGVTSLIGTITGFTSSSVVTISVNASTTISNAVVMWGTDDTAAIQSAVNAAVAFAVANSGAADVFFPVSSGFYVVAGALVTGGTTKGNSQITIPVIASTANKVVLTFRGGANGSAFQHWQQQYPQISGSTIVSFGVHSSTSAQITSINNAGNSAVIGGPSQPEGYGTSPGTFSNMLVTVKDMSILTTHSSYGLTYSALDFSGIAEANLFDFAYGTAGVVPSGDYGNPNVFATGLSIGVLMPAAGNNDNCEVKNVSCHGGYTYAFFATEHTVANAMRILYSWSALCVVGNYFGSVGSTHSIKISQISIEACTNVIYIIGSGSAGIGPWIDVDQLDTESGAPTFADNNNGTGLGNALGTVKLTGLYTAANVTSTYPTGIKIIDGQKSFPVTTVTGNYTAHLTDEVILVDASSGAVTVTLISAARTPNKYTVKKIDSSSNAVTVAAASGQNIDGSSTKNLASQWDKLTVIPSGTNWFTV